MKIQRTDLRNVAIIAHVDHGKTTLVDGLLRQAGTFRANEQVAERVMDSNDLERERGITILAKNTAINYQDTHINIVDTPGHADFSGEVERILSMVDGCLLIVDAAEGPMAQTRFVLRKAMESHLKPVVVINKIDRHDRRITEVVDEVLDLFIELGADNELLDFPVLYASGRDQYAKYNENDPAVDLKPLFDTILRQVPVPEGDPEGVPQFMVTSLDYDDYVGRIAIGRIHQGKLRPGMNVGVVKRDGSLEKSKIGLVYGYEGLKKVQWQEATVGDIVALTGLDNVGIGETVTDPDTPQALPVIHVDEPTLRMTFQTNDSPFTGREGKYITSRHLRARLLRELEKNVALQVEETDSPDVFQVAGRGELHLSILIETMRREGYELAVSKPEVITKQGDNGELLEPLEHLTVDVPEEYTGVIMEHLGLRKGEMQNMTGAGTGTVRLEFIIPARGLIGLRSELLTDTKGYAIMHHLFHAYGPWRGDLPSRLRGSLVASETGTTTAYALNAIGERGVLFVEPGTDVYMGMVVGENSREQDMDVNACKQKHLTNVRSATSDIAVRLDPARILSLEEALEQVADDELVEVTPKTIRLRKKYLDPNARDRISKGKEPRAFGPRR